MKHDFSNEYESTMICPICGKTGIVRCKESVDIEFESDEVNASMQYVYPTTSNLIKCNRCRSYMIRCANENVLALMRSIVDLGLIFESFSEGRAFSDTVSINVDTHVQEVVTNYVNPVLSIFIPVDDPKRCIGIIEMTKSLFDGVKDISYEFYAAYGDYGEYSNDYDYSDINDILSSLNRGDIEFDYLKLYIHCNETFGGVIDENKADGYDDFVKHCLDLMNSFKELNA